MINILTVSENKELVKDIEKRIKSSIKGADLISSGNLSKACELVKDKTLNMAFIEMTSDSDKQEEEADLIQRLKSEHPKAHIVLMSDEAGDALKAFDVHAEGFVLESSLDKIGDEIRYYRRKTSEKKTQVHTIKIRCFGNFECFIDGMPAKFKYQKSKELLAYLIDRGGSMCDNKELISILWGNSMANKVSYLKNIKVDLKEVLENAGFGDLIIQGRGVFGLKTDDLDCDYYNFLRGKRNILGTYWGEYMNQYSWGKGTREYLNKYYLTKTYEHTGGKPLNMSNTEGLSR